MKKLFAFYILAVCVFTLKAQAPNQQVILENLNNALAQYEDGDYQNALNSYLEAGKLLENDTSKLNRQVFVLSQTMAIKCYEKLKLYNDAFTLCGELMEIDLTEQERTELKDLYVNNGYGLALTYYKKKLYADARELLNRILPYAADTEQRNIIQARIPGVWFSEGAQYEINRQYNEALPCYVEARNGFHANNDTIKEINALYSIGSILGNRNDIMGALEVYQIANELALQKKYDKTLISILKEQIKLSNLIGDTVNAFKYDMMIDSLIIATNDTSAIIEVCNKNGAKAYNLKLYDIALQYYKKSEQYAQRLGKRYYNFYTLYLGLSNVYKKLGQYDKAFEYAEKSNTEWERNNRKNEFKYQVLADIYCHMNDSTNCFLYADSLLTVINQLDDPKLKYMPYALRARYHSAFKDYNQALADFKEADRILATKYSETDDDRVQLLGLIGNMEHQLKNYEESESLHRLYAERIKNLYGENSINYIHALNYYANAEGFAGHFEAGCNDYTQAVGLAKSFIHERLPYLTSAERQGFWEEFSDMIFRMTPFALESRQFQTSFTESCYDGLVFSKSFLLSTERSTFDIINQYGSSEDKKDYATIVSLINRIKEWEKDYSANSDSILHVTNQINLLEKKLMSNCRSYGDMASFMTVGYKGIKQELGDNDVLIDFTDFTHRLRGRVYAAYIINNNQDYPLLKELFTESTIDSMQVAFKNWYYEEPYASEIYHLLWEPFKEHINEGATVYYVPSQFLFQIALESIPLQDGTLLGDHYQFVRLSSAREILNASSILNLPEEKQEQIAVLYGGLKYDVSPDVMEQESSKYSNLFVVPYYAQRSTMRGDSIFKDLPWTKTEIDGIGNALVSKKISVLPYMGSAGTEESFLSMNGRAPSILHIATHGFYFTPKVAEKLDYLSGYQDAMMLSGLVLSGANAAWRGNDVPERSLDGILTAEEISHLDLSGVEMAVLSACQTGQGKATPEGLYGLQRAFKKAGVKTLIMSLWNVSDKVSSEFMIEFYKQLVNPKKSENRWNKRNAFNEAKRKIRQKHDDPYYWAPFIMLD